jgi:hypothetical protein
VKVLIGGGALTLSATLTVTISLDMTGGSLVGDGTHPFAQLTGESVERLVCWTATAFNNVLPQGMAVVTSGFALRVEGAGQKTVRDWTLDSEGACEWNYDEILFGQSVLPRLILAEAGRLSFLWICRLIAYCFSPRCHSRPALRGNPTWCCLRHLLSLARRSLLPALIALQRSLYPARIFLVIGAYVRGLRGTSPLRYAL